MACKGRIVHQTGSYTEKPSSIPEYCPFLRDHNESVADNLEVDAKRNPGVFCREKSGREPDQPFPSALSGHQ